MSEKKTDELVRTPGFYFGELETLGERGFMERYDHPFLFSLLEKTAHVRQFPTQTVKVQRPSARRRNPNATFYCLPLTRERTNPFTIGRFPTCDMVVNDSTISGLHALVGTALQMATTDPELLEEGRARYAKRRCQIQDYGSSNGTVINGQRIAPQENVDLTNGDVIVLGDGLILQFVQGKRTCQLLEKYQWGFQAE